MEITRFDLADTSSVGRTTGRATTKGRKRGGEQRYHDLVSRRVKPRDDRCGRGERLQRFVHRNARQWRVTTLLYARSSLTSLFLDRRTNFGLCPNLFTCLFFHGFFPPPLSFRCLLMSSRATGWLPRGRSRNPPLAIATHALGQECTMPRVIKKKLSFRRGRKLIFVGDDRWLIGSKHHIPCLMMMAMVAIAVVSCCCDLVTFTA